MARADERIRRIAKGGAMVLPAVALALGFAAISAPLHELRMEVEYRLSLFAAISGGPLLALAVVVVTSVALHRAATDRPPAPAALLGPPLVPWVLGLAEMASIIDERTGIGHGVSSRESWLMTIGPALTPLIVGAAGSTALLASSALVLAIALRAETGPRRAELRASTALAVVATTFAVAGTWIATIERSTHRALWQAVRSERGGIALAAAARIGTAHAVLTAAGAVALALLALAVRAAMRAGVRIDHRALSAIGCVAVVVAAHLGMRFYVERACLASAAPPWAMLHGFAPITIDTDAYDHAPPGALPVDSAGMHDPADPSARVVTPAELAQRWAEERLAEERRTEERGGRVVYWDPPVPPLGDEDDRGCPLHADGDELSVAPHRDLPASTLGSLAQAIPQDLVTQIELAGTAPTSVDRSVASALPIVYAQLAFEPRTVWFSLPRACAPSSDDAYVIAARVGPSGMRLAWYFSGEPIDPEHDVDALDLGEDAVVLVVPGDGARAQDLADAAARLASIGSLSTARRALVFDLTPAPVRRWSVRWESLDGMDETVARASFEERISGIASCAANDVGRWRRSLALRFVIRTRVFGEQSVVRADRSPGTGALAECYRDALDGLPRPTTAVEPRFDVTFTLAPTDGAATH
jgi:hypothetical protein